MNARSKKFSPIIQVAFAASAKTSFSHIELFV